MAYFVGGYPRDLYLGIDTIDYDITTNATPKEMIILWETLSISAILRENSINKHH